MQMYMAARIKLTIDIVFGIGKLNTICTALNVISTISYT